MSTHLFGANVILDDDSLPEPIDKTGQQLEHSLAVQSGSGAISAQSVLGALDSPAYRNYSRRGSAYALAGPSSRLQQQYLSAVAIITARE